MVAWMLGSVTGYVIGEHGGRALLDHPGLLENSRRELLAKGDRAFGRYNFLASVTMPAFVSGIFRVRFWVFVLGALVAGTGWIGMYVGLSYFLRRGARQAHRKRRREGNSRRHRDRRHRTDRPGWGGEVARFPATAAGGSGRTRNPCLLTLGLIVSAKMLTNAPERQMVGQQRLVRYITNDLAGRDAATAGVPYRRRAGGGRRERCARARAD